MSRISILALLLVASTAHADDVSFLRDVAPILLQRCAGCHGEKKTEGGYRLNTFENLIRAGDSEEPSVVAGKPSESELLRRIIETDEDLRMPRQDDPLSEQQVATIRKWIEAGAPFDGSHRDGSLRTQLPPRQHPDPPKTYRAAVPVLSVAFSPDGRELAVSGFHEVTIWNADNAQLVRRLKRMPQQMQKLEYSKDGSTLLVAGGSPGDYGEVSLVDAASGEVLRVLGTFGDLVLDAAFNHDGSRIVAGSADRTVRVYETATGKLAWQASLHSDWITGVDFTRDSRFVVSSSKDLTAKVYEAVTGTLFTTYNGHQKQYGKYTGRYQVYDVVCSDEGPQAFTAGQGQTINIWEPEKARGENGTAGDMEQRFAKEGHTKYVEHGYQRNLFALNVRGGMVFSASGDGLVKQHEVESGKQIRQYQGHSDYVFAIDYHPTRKLAASGAFDGEVRIWHTETGECLHTFKAMPK